ncbi:MAG: hypothetical protein ACK493_15560 [Planctomycetota bacterium]
MPERNQLGQSAAIGLQNEGQRVSAMFGATPLGMTLPRAFVPE